MRAEWAIGPFMELQKRRIESAMVVIGAAGVGFTSNQLRSNGYSEATKVRTGNLVNSITYSTSQQKGPVAGIGKQLSPADELAVKIGSTVVYAARVEFGFVGKDSLGRNFHQAAKSYLRAGIAAHKTEIMNVFKQATGG